MLAGLSSSGGGGSPSCPRHILVAMAFTVQYGCPYRTHWYELDAEFETRASAVNACVREYYKRNVPCQVLDENGVLVYKIPQEVQKRPERKGHSGRKRCCK